MKIKILLALIVVNLIQAQKFYFPKNAVSDSAVLEKQLPVLASKLMTQPSLTKLKNTNRLAYLDNLFRLQIVARDYKKSIATPVGLPE
ncbi:hypothetical protein [Chryseobacterium carnipullorum]|uniref:Uncharacterized protein n=1 Tax=Chryseobacterium carnipullorum TaxID=1124835 RepID=A0A376DTM6_CHRCU|nr:hypothetical protein [Chryseobacterium carnipullorum]STC95369.1 Uncharacterised protein [Chryseobacterium carnipullorum]